MKDVWVNSDKSKVLIIDDNLEAYEYEDFGLPRPRLTVSLKGGNQFIVFGQDAEELLGALKRHFHFIK
jgi:hypothetical protein